MSTKTRVVGSGHTMLYFNHKRIAMLDSFRDTGQSPVAPPEPVQTLDERHPSEIAVARAVGAGTITADIREAWHEPVWQQLLRLVTSDERALAAVNDLPGVQDLIDNALPGELMLQMVITNPSSTPGAGMRGKTYHNCVITDFSDGETVTLGQLTIAKTITLMYTHTTFFHGAKGTVPNS